MKLRQPAFMKEVKSPLSTNPYAYAVGGAVLGGVGAIGYNKLRDKTTPYTEEDVAAANRLTNAADTYLPEREKLAGSAQETEYYNANRDFEGRIKERNDSLGLVNPITAGAWVGGLAGIYGLNKDIKRQYKMIGRKQLPLRNMVQ